MTAQTILDQDPTQAVAQIIDTVETLIALMDEESRAMTMKDAVGFTAAQEQKNRLSVQYEAMAEEFKARLMEFRGIDRALLDRLDGLQRDLVEKTQGNMKLMESLQG